MIDILCVDVCVKHIKEELHLLLVYLLSLVEEADGDRGLLDRTVYGVENSSSFLECSPKSQRALIYWLFQRHGEDRKQEVC